VRHTRVRGAACRSSTWSTRRSRSELRNLLVTLVFGAHDNTRHQFSNSVVTFAEHPTQWTLLRERPELAERAVGETMRWRPSAASVFRRAAEDFEFRGLPIAAGTFVTVAVQTAQRDPRAYPGGDVFDITAVREAPLLQFGAGPHYCLGSALAHAELGEALPVLVRRFDPPVLAGEVIWRPPIGTHGPDALPLRLSAR
jgi:cytochrome P450